MFDCAFRGLGWKAEVTEHSIIFQGTGEAFKSPTMAAAEGEMKGL